MGISWRGGQGVWEWGLDARVARDPLCGEAAGCSASPPSRHVLTPWLAHCTPPPTPPRPRQDKKNQDPSEGGQRVVTALMYLATPEEGGETVFPDAQVQAPPPQEGSPPPSACASKGLVNKAYKGDMIM